MTNRFCVLVLFDYPCDMDHESESKYILLLLYNE